MIDSAEPQSSLRRALGLLRLVGAAEAGGIRLKDLAEQAGCSQPTAHRALQDLAAEGFVEQIGKRYRLALDFFVLAARAGHADGLRDLAKLVLLRLSATLPDNLPVRLQVGSGDAWVNGTASLDANVGSGDLDIKRVRGQVSAKVGSGDVEIADVGSLHVPSIGSGDVSAGNVRGDVEVGSIGSGDFSLDRAGGSVRIGSIGSGDASLAAIGGAVEVGSVGSGDVEVRGAASLTVRSVGSGDIDHRDVRGAVNIPRRR